MLDGRVALVLEDEPIIGFAIEDMLSSLGCAKVHVATRVDEARHLLESCRVDVAVLDVNIHGQRSYPIADMLTDLGVPFIFATGYGELEHPPRHRSVPTVTKPYSSADVRSAISRSASARSD